MKQIMLLLLLVTISFSCTKSVRKEAPIVCILPPVIPAWLESKKADYSKCICLTGFRAGIYQNTRIFEIYIFDPACFGTNIVYKVDGTTLFSSNDKAAYADYTEQVQQQTVIWTCSK